MTTEEMTESRVVHLADGLRFESGPDRWSLAPVTVHNAEWVALIPDGQEPVVDPAGPLSRIVATLLEPEVGTVELLSHNVYRMEYGARQRLRARIGFVHGYGGLLANRNIRENIALPVSVHGGMSEEEETATVSKSLRTFGLTEVAEMYPHQVDGATRWAVCLARALVLQPEYLVLEGIGSWEMDRGRSTSWKSLMEYRHTGIATVICLPRQNPGFQSWFEKHGGKLIKYRRAEAPARGRTR
jgi:predicted ABC-type transport system involved in lysophospholipase L1 biosynthesis ATPase subunit